MSLLSIIASVRLSLVDRDMNSCRDESLVSIAPKSPSSLPFIAISSVFGSTIVGSAGKLNPLDSSHESILNITSSP